MIRDEKLLLPIEKKDPPKRYIHIFSGRYAVGIFRGRWPRDLARDKIYCAPTSIQLLSGSVRHTLGFALASSSNRATPSLSV